MRRAIYLANVLGVDMGMYYRRLDYSKMVKGRHPIAAYEFLGPKLEGKDVILIDDMISSGKSILEIASLLKKTWRWQDLYLHHLRSLHRRNGKI